MEATIMKEGIMPSSEEMFQHSYRDGLRELELNRAQNEVTLKDLQEPSLQAQRILLKQYDKMMHAIIAHLTLEKPDPDLVLQKGLRALNRVEQFRFLLENLLEAVKRDDSLQNSLIRFYSLELIDLNDVSLSEEKRKSPWPSNLRSGRLLRKLWDSLRKVALTLMEIVVNAIKIVPTLVSIKPKPSVGLSGPFPTFSLQFDLEAESITIHELFHALTGSTRVEDDTATSGPINSPSGNS